MPPAIITPVLFRRILAICLGWLGGLAPLSAAVPADEGWELLSGYLFRDAYEAFTREPAGPDRRRALGEAVGLLNHPPVTPGKIARAEAQMRALITADGTDEAALYARYMLARVAHVHRAGDTAEVEAAYRAVLAAAPEHALAQIAAGKLALVLLYQRPDLTVAERLAAAAALEPVAAGGALPEVAVAYYRALAGAALYYDQLNEQMLGWLVRADEIGTVEIMGALSLRIQIAETARALGQRELALRYYRSFLDTAVPTDNRHRTARERMAELEAAP